MIVEELYQTTFGWLARVFVDGLRHTLEFRERPTQADIEAAVAAMEVPPQTTVEIEAEDGTVIL